MAHSVCNLQKGDNMSVEDTLHTSQTRRGLMRISCPRRQALDGMLVQPTNTKTTRDRPQQFTQPQHREGPAADVYIHADKHHT
jgi:hypothetical protein